MGETMTTSELDGVQEGDEVLFAERKERLTVRELNNLDTTDALPYARLEGPRGGEVYIKEKPDEPGFSGPSGTFDELKVLRPADEPPGPDAPVAFIEYFAAEVFGLGMIDNVRVNDVANFGTRERIAVEFSPMPTTGDRMEFNNRLRENGVTIQRLDPPTLYLFMPDAAEAASEDDAAGSE